MNLEEIKVQYPPEYINALGSKDMDNIRALIAEVERLSCEHEAIDLKKALQSLAAVSDSLTLREIIETSDFPAAIKCIERLSCEGKRYREALNEIMQIPPYPHNTRTTWADKFHKARNLAEKALGTVSEGQTPKMCDKHPDREEAYCTICIINAATFDSEGLCPKCGETYSGAFCPCSYEVLDDAPNN